jgi:hypothetical protein
MAIKIMASASTSAHYHVYLGYGAPNPAISVSTGLANSRTLLIPIHSDNIRFTFNGTFGSGSASTQVIIDVSPNGADASPAWFPILTVSAPQTTVLPIQVDHTIRFRQQWTSAAVAITNASVDAWIG